MKKFLKKVLNPNEYYKEINGYYNLPDDLREKLEHHDKNFGDKGFDKFFSWGEFKEIISIVHFLMTFRVGNNEIYILNDGRQYVYWIENMGEKIEEKISQNAFEMLDNIYIEDKLMSEIWGNFD